MMRLHYSSSPSRQRRHKYRHLLKSTVLGFVVAVLGAPALMLPAIASAQEERVTVQSATVNINVADASSLAAALSGIGLSRAEAIVRYREAYGPFESVDELLDVKGIGPATLDANRATITLE